MVRFQCPDCPRDFSHRAHLRNHIKTYEKEKIEQELIQLQTEQDNIDMLIMLEESSNDEIEYQQFEECLDISEENNANMMNNESNNFSNEQESNNEVSFLSIFYIHKEQ